MMKHVMENCPLSSMIYDDLPIILIVIFHSYIELPEGISMNCRRFQKLQPRPDV